MSNTPTTLADLIPPDSQANELSLLLADAGLPGSFLTTTAWQALGVVRTWLVNFSYTFAQAVEAITTAAQGGYIDQAAALVDSQGNPTYAALNQIGMQTCNLQRIGPVSASGLVPITNSGSSIAVPALGLTLTNYVTGAVYQNLTALTIANGTASYSFTAQIAGAAGSSAPGVVLLIALSSLTKAQQAQLTIGALVAPAIVGSDAQTNPQYLASCLAQLEPVATNGASTIWEQVAAAAATSTPVTRVGLYAEANGSEVFVVLANAYGPCSSADVAIVAAAFVGVAESCCVDPIVEAAALAFVVVSGTLYVPAGAQPISGGLLAAVHAALNDYFSQIPLGGYGTGVVPLSGIQNVIQTTATGIVGPLYAARVYTDVYLGNPPGKGDFPIPANTVPVCGFLLTVAYQ